MDKLEDRIQKTEYRNWKAFYLLSFVFFILILLDQATKYFVYSKGAGGFLNSFRPIFGLQLFPNNNLAFSIHVPQVLMWFLYVALLLLLIIWFWMHKKKNFFNSLALVLILAGALSNIFDRLWLGYVRDFVFVFWGNVFNVADVFILGGIILLLIFA